MNGQQQAPDERGSAEGMPVDLAQVQKHAVELLAQLDRPPRSLRIRAGGVAVDISWADRGSTGPADAVLAPPTWTAQPAAATAPAPADTGTSTGIDSGANSVADNGAGADGAAREYLRSPGVGIFYHAAEPGAAPFVSVDSRVEPGQQIGIIEAMKLMVPVEADRGGRITEVLKANGEPVEFDEPLFALE